MSGGTALPLLYFIGTGMLVLSVYVLQVEGNVQSSAVLTILAAIAFGAALATHLYP